jgi:Ca2+-binding RTX toxin-like protein
MAKISIRKRRFPIRHSRSLNDQKGNMAMQTNLVETLETRRLLSAAIQIHDGTLIVRGTPQADVIVVRSLGPIPVNAVNAVPPMLVTINGRQRTIELGKIRRVRVEAGAGDDLVTMTHNNIADAVLDVEQRLPATIFGGDGNDTLIGGDAADYISGGAGKDSITGWTGNDTLEGDGNSDVLDGDSGKDLLRGGNGNDQIVTDDAGDSVSGGAGFDLVLNPNNTPVKLDELEASATAAALNLLPEFSFAEGVLTVYGTPRSDRIAMSSLFNSNPQAFDVQVNNRQIDKIERSVVHKVVVLVGDGDDSIVEGPESLNSAFTPEFQAFSIPMEVHGDAGNDTIIGGWADDSLSGGEGDDEIAGALGNDAIDGGAGNDTLRGNDGADTLRGRKGEDSLDGGDGSDVVNGGQGNDAVFGGAGVDYFEWPTDGVNETKDIDSSDVTDPAPGYYF